MLRSFKKRADGFISPIHTQTHTAPSAAPSPVAVLHNLSTTITVQWGSVPCIHQNGDIIGYSVRYMAQGKNNTLMLPVTVTEATIDNLNPSTNYSIRVAAINSAGIGVYSEPTYKLTEGL